VVVGAVALVAGAALLPVAVVLGSSMVLLQFAIGALNDVHDAPTDGGRVPPKPIPGGLVRPRVARLVVVVCAALGLAMAAAFGTTMLLLAGLVLAIGFGYDLALRGTAWSWLPFAVGIPILPVFGWFGATGTLPGWALALIPSATFAGAALAVANAWADHERDAERGVVTVATAMGERGVRLALGVTWLAAGVIALAWLVWVGAEPPAVATFLAACALVGVGFGLGWAGSPDRLEWAWRVQAVGAAVAAVSWLGAIVSIG
jgi:4-hydroxybenzoate polyprenyltransferase